MIKYFSIRLRSIVRASLRVTFGALLLLSSVASVNAQTQLDECGWMQRSKNANDEPLTQQELIELREQEIIQLANQSEHCLSQAGGSGQQGANGEGKGGSGNQGAAVSAGDGSSRSESTAGAPLTKAEQASQASSNHLQEGEASSSSSSVAKGTYTSASATTTSVAEQGDYAKTSQPSTQTEKGTGIGAPRASAASADNKERLRQQLRDKISTTDDPELKKKLQQRLDDLK